MRELTFTEAAREGLSEEMARDPRVFVVGEGIGARGGNFNTTTGLFERHGAERLRDTPITERGFTGLCTGAAMTGARPVVDYMFFDFALDALGELLNQTSKIQYMSDGRLRMPIVLRGCVGVGHSAATHHSGSYYPIFTNIPGFRVAVPTTPADAKGLLKTAIRSDDPVVFMEHRSLLQTRGPVPDGEHLVPFGRAAVARAGTDVTVIGVAVMVQRAVAAADVLAREGVSVEVIDPRTLAVRDRRRDRRAGGGSGVRRPRRADPAGQRSPHPGPLQPASREGGGAGRGRRRPRRPRPPCRVARGRPAGWPSSAPGRSARPSPACSREAGSRSRSWPRRRRSVGSGTWA